MKKLAAWLVASAISCLGAGAHPTFADSAGGDDLIPYEVDQEIVEMTRMVTRHRLSNREKVEAITRLIFDRRHGLGFDYASHPTLTAIEAKEQRYGNCLSLVNLFVAMSRSAGVRTFFVEVEDFETFERYSDSVVRSTHVVGGVVLGRELKTVDFVPDRPKIYRKLRILSDEEATAHYFNAVGAEALLAGDLPQAEGLLSKAIEIQPDLTEAWNNLAVTARRGNRLDEAIAHLRHALEIDPEFAPAVENLSGFYRLQGDTERARAMADRALELKTVNPYYLIEQAHRSFRRGDLETTEDLAKRARRLDKRIPEAHLMLGRVALERGDEKKAERLFTRAQRHGGDFPGDYQRKLDTKIDRLMAAR